jgi:hypothetical protein
MPPPANSPIARARLDLDALPRVERLDRWREALEPVFEITPDPAENGAAFSGAIAMAHLDVSVDFGRFFDKNKRLVRTRTERVRT